VVLSPTHSSTRSIEGCQGTVLNGKAPVWACKTAVSVRYAGPNFPLGNQGEFLLCLASQKQRIEWRPSPCPVRGWLPVLPWPPLALAVHCCTRLRQVFCSCTASRRAATPCQSVRAGCSAAGLWMPSVPAHWAVLPALVQLLCPYLAWRKRGIHSIPEQHPHHHLRNSQISVLSSRGNLESVCRLPNSKPPSSLTHPERQGLGTRAHSHAGPCNAHLCCSRVPPSTSAMPSAPPPPRSS
jgi:hypothetical protein